jgi:decaprenylphospho-beta-D-erythro-pentofuranosid-2-ulose 2-reductase
MTKTLIIGATSSLAFPLCHLLAAQGDELVLAGKDHAELQRLQQDLLIHHSVSISMLLCDLDTSDFDVKTFANTVPHIERLIMIAGYMGNDKADRETDKERIANINFNSPEIILRAFAKQLTIQKKGEIIIISSVAGDIIRKKNKDYSLAKRKLSKLGKELHKALKPLGINVLTVKPGFIDTPMTYGMESPLIASREHVARTIMLAMQRKQKTLYTPFFWQYIMLALKLLPKWLINKLGI